MVLVVHTCCQVGMGVLAFTPIPDVLAHTHPSVEKDKRSACKKK